MSISDFRATKSAPAERAIFPQKNKAGREANRIYALLLEHLDKSDVDGARSELQTWLSNVGWRRGSNQELAILLLLMTERMGDLITEKVAEPPPLALTDPVDRPGREAYATSIHFSLLTAAILRQREQIKNLMNIVESLSRRLA